MTPDCDQPAQWKGVCSCCYGQAKRVMEAHGLTWRDLETLGLVRLEHKPFIKAYDAAVERELK